MKKQKQLASVPYSDSEAPKNNTLFGWLIVGSILLATVGMTYAYLFGINLIIGN